MRVQTLIIFLLGFSSLPAQIIECEDQACSEVKIPQDDLGNYIFQQVIEVPGSTAGELYSQAKMLVAELYNSSDHVIQSADESANWLIGKAWSPIQVGMAAVKLRYTFKIEAKDGRYRYSIHDIIYDASNASIIYESPIETLPFEVSVSSGRGSKKAKNVRASWLTTINNLQSSIIAGMAASKLNDDW